MSEFINTVSKIGEDALMDGIIQRSLTEFYDEFVSVVGPTALGFCTSLVAVNLPVAEWLQWSAFTGCTALKIIDLPKVAKIDVNVFQGCTALSAVILRNTEQICALQNTAVFTSTPIAKGTGYNYVPRKFLSDTDAAMDYRRATNWSTYATQFRALEDYTVDGTTTGELDETKI